MNTPLFGNVRLQDLDYIPKGTYSLGNFVPSTTGPFYAVAQALASAREPSGNIV